MDEFTKTIQNNTHLSDATKSVYRSNYKRLMKITENELIGNFSENRIVKLLDEADMPATSKNGLVSLILLIREMQGKNSVKLIGFRDQKIRKQRADEKHKVNTELREELPSLQELENHTKDLFRNHDYVSYVVNFLLLRFGVRNKDLNILITANKDMASIKNPAKINYLYVTHKYVTFIRNDYKTYSTYGRQVHKIEITPFTRAVKEILGDNLEMPLLAVKFDENISESSLSQTIKRKTYQELGEGKYFKIIINALKKKGDIRKIRALAKNRGTDLETVFNEYDIDADV